MSELLQAGQHPDADQLNAFVERTLPDHEQQQTLEHLAVCPACRQIVALALPPVDELAARGPELVRNRWFSPSRLAWTGIPALAAVVLLVIFTRTSEVPSRQTSVPAQMANALPPAPAVSAAPPVEAPKAALVPRRSIQKRAPSPADQLAQGTPGGVMGGILGGASVGGPVSMLARNRGQYLLAAPSVLPSHLAVLSMVSHENQRLALDTTSQLFFSDDGGRHWKAIPAQWKGHALRVALTAGGLRGSEAPALMISAQPAATTASTLSGTIRDESGAVIPGVTVAAIDSSGAVVRSVMANSEGQFRMEHLATGSYRIEAQAAGFITQSVAAEIAPAQQTVTDFTLRVGSVSQTVMVQSSAAPADQLQASETLVHFELTTDDGERWMSTDGVNWNRE